MTYLFFLQFSVTSSIINENDVADSKSKRLRSYLTPLIRTQGVKYFGVLTSKYKKFIIFTNVYGRWKVARIRSLDKKAFKWISSNYRSISLISVISRVMESIINCYVQPANLYVTDSTVFSRKVNC